MYVLDQMDNSAWWIGTWAGRRGYVPSSYLKELPPVDLPTVEPVADVPQAASDGAEEQAGEATEQAEQPQQAPSQATTQDQPKDEL
jgi:hypothetical protein